jgi:hypothetical protein
MSGVALRVGLAAFGVAAGVIVAFVVDDTLHVRAFAPGIGYGAAGILLAAIMAGVTGALAGFGRKAPRRRIGMAVLGSAFVAATIACTLVRLREPWLDLGPFGAGPFGAVSVVTLGVSQLFAVVMCDAILSLRPPMDENEVANDVANDVANEQPPT